MDKVTVRFESTIENKANEIESNGTENDTLLLSGPIEIFATIDVIKVEPGISGPTLDEINEATGLYNVTEADHTEGKYLEYEVGEWCIDKYADVSKNKIALQSPYIAELVHQYYLTTNKRPVIYVENVTNYPDQYRNRGAYFVYAGSKVINDKVNVFWREVLLGVHSHTKNEMLRIRELALLSEESAQNLTSKILGVNENGELYLEDKNEGKTIPDFPAELQEQLDALKRYNELFEPTEAEWNHLDAPLDQLDNTYDWEQKDENGNYNNLAIGNCRDLYRSLLASEKRLYISDDYVLSDTEGNWVSLDIYKVNFNTEETYDDAIDVKILPKNKNFYALGINLSSNIGSEDEIFLLNNGNMLSDEQYDILSIKNSFMSILFNRYDKQFKDVCTLTVLIVRDAKGIKGFRTGVKNAFTSGDITLNEINNRIARNYVEYEFDKRPNLPKLYLTNDQYGNLVWDNKLLPTQTFYADTMVITNENIEIVERDEREYVKIVFKGVNYELKRDFPLLMVNDFFVFSVKPDETESGKDIVYYLPVNPISGEGQYDFDMIEPNEYRNVTLVLIKNSAAGSVADELAQNYVSKEDAVAILSHGKLNLRDYVTKTDAIKFSKIGHTHSQYSLINHNHDERYANFHHTHPEIIAAVAALTGSGTTDIENWLNQLDSRQAELLTKILKNVGFKQDNVGIDTEGELIKGKYYLEDSSVMLSESTYEAIKELCSHYTGLAELPEKLAVSEALDIISKIFEIDTVKDSQVLLEKDIPVKLVNGPIGGITYDRTYKKDTPLNVILQDMLNPHIDVDRMRELLTPDVRYSKIKWYTIDNTLPSDNIPVEIDIKNLAYSDNSIPLLFKIEFRNQYNQPCEQEIFYDGNVTKLKTTIDLTRNNTEFSEFDEYGSGGSWPIDETDYWGEYNSEKYYYARKYFNLTENLELRIETKWISNIADDVIYDNYGQNQGILNENSEKITLKDYANVTYPSVFYGSAASVNSIVSEFETSISEGGNIDYSNDLLAKFKVNTSEMPVIVVAIDSELYDSKTVNIYDKDLSFNITRFFKDFKEINNDNDLTLYDGKRYVCLYYECMDRNSALNLSLSLENKED